MKIKEIIRPGGHKIFENNSMDEIVRLMSSSDEKTFCVVNKDNEVTGIISPKALIKLFIPGYFDLLENLNFIDNFGPLEKLFIEKLDFTICCSAIVAKDIMFLDPITLDENASVLKAASIMVKNRIDFIPVLNSEKKYAGALREKDIFKFILNPEPLDKNG